MKKSLLSILLFVGSIVLCAQTKDASTVYQEFVTNSTIVKTAPQGSLEYELASQAMLQLFPLLQHHAAWFSQHGQPNNAITFAKAYVDMAMMPQFAEMHLEKSEPYGQMAYFLGSSYYNRKDYGNAAIYLQRYIDLDKSDRRLTVFQFLAKCYEKTGDSASQLQTIDMGLREYPYDQNLLALAINVRMEKGYYQEALPYIEQSLSVRNSDTNLLSLKGQCLEGLQRYKEAASLYSMLILQKKTLNNYKHYAVNLYNCAVNNYATDKDVSLTYFGQVIPVLEQVVLNDPTSVDFTRALAMSYLYTDQYEQLERTNKRLRAIGAEEVETSTLNQLTPLTSDIPRASQMKQQDLAANNTKQDKSAIQPDNNQSNKPKAHASSSKGFQEFAKNYIEKEILLWQQKDPFETIGEYTERVTEQSRNQKVTELILAAKKEYIKRNTKKLRNSDFQLLPYDAENRVFLIQSAYGDIVLPVPRENNEARNFANTWKDVNVDNAEFDIAGDDLVIRSIDFITRTGNTYHYSDSNERKYSQAEINMQFDKIDYSNLNNKQKKNDVKIEKNTVTVGNSDVDINIPVNKSTHTNRFAFLIGNENYQQLSTVQYALQDVRIMKQYCIKTLGIPESNVRIYENATFGAMLSCVRDIKNIAQAYNGDIDIIFYYAGHGMPDERSKSAYLLPIDADGIQTETCYAVNRLYQELGQLGARSVIVFMDACFSGSQRGDGMLASARGVALKPKPDAPQGKMVTFSAATGEETAFPYHEQQHGLFTYYVLKCLQTSKGKTSLGDLAEYVKTQVKQRSVVINNKSQTPTVNASPEAQDWHKWNFK